MQPCSLLSLATAVPPHVVAQDYAKDAARRIWGGKPALFDRLSGVFDNAGIAQRHIVTPADWYERSHGWHDRNALYLEASQDLFERAAASAIEKAGLKPNEIDGVVTVSTTGIATPSLEARVGPKLGLRPDVRRVPVFGLGCAGGVNGLAITSRLASADTGSNWLFVVRVLIRNSGPKRRGVGSDMRSSRRAARGQPTSKTTPLPIGHQCVASILIMREMRKRRRGRCQTNPA